MIQENIPKDRNLEYYVRDYIQDYRRDSGQKSASQKRVRKQRGGNIVSSSNVRRRILIGSDEEKRNFDKARILVRSAIYKHLTNFEEPWITRENEGGCAINREQVYKWTKKGYREAYDLLKYSGITVPESLPSKRDAKLVGKTLTAVWLMYWRNGTVLHPSLKDGEFTVPLIASELTRLIY